MVNTTVILVVATTALSGIAAGASLDVSIRQLPARHRIGVIAYSVYSQATDLGTARVWYPPLGIGTLLLALATAVMAFFQHVAFPMHCRSTWPQPCGLSICSSRSSGRGPRFLANGSFPMTNTSLPLFSTDLSVCKPFVQFWTS